MDWTACSAAPEPGAGWLACPGRPLIPRAWLLSALCCAALALGAGLVCRAHERLAREHNKLKGDDRAMRLEALKVCWQPLWPLLALKLLIGSRSWVGGIGKSSSSSCCAAVSVKSDASPPNTGTMHTPAISPCPPCLQAHDFEAYQELLRQQTGYAGGSGEKFEAISRFLHGASSANPSSLC